MTHDGINPDIPRRMQGIDRPFWQTGTCPKWCTSVHSDADFRGDRFHFGDTTGVALTMERAHQVGDTREDVVAQRIDIELFQGYREVEPHLTFGLRNGHFGIRLTLQEGEDIAHALLAAIRVAQEEKR